MSDEPRWEGVEGSHCHREHRTTGIRAWCSNCGEWCYVSEGQHCRGCTIQADGFYLVTRPDLVVSAVNLYPRTGTIQITLKKE